MKTETIPTEGMSFESLIRPGMSDRQWKRWKKNFGEKDLSFKPCVFYHRGMDHLEYHEKDASVVTAYIPGSNVETLVADYGTERAQIVGVKINGFSHVVPLSVLKAFIRNQERYKNYPLIHRLRCAWEGFRYG